MSPTELIELFDKNPRGASRLTLAGGDVILVDNPARTIFKDWRVIVGQSDDPMARRAQRLQFVSIPNITLVEGVDRNRPRGRRRSR